MTDQITAEKPTRGVPAWGKALAALTLAGALVGSGITAAQAQPYGGSVTPGGITLSATGLSGSASTGYTLNVDTNDPGNTGTSGTITVTATGTGLNPAVSGFPSAYNSYYNQPGDVIPTGNGAYVSLGRADLLAAAPDSGASSTRSAAKTYWLHDGTLDRILAGSEANWTPTAGSFSVTFTVPWTYNAGTGKYTLGSSTTTADPDDRTFQVYTLNALGAPNAANERVVDLTLTAP